MTAAAIFLRKILRWSADVQGAVLSGAAARARLLAPQRAIRGRIVRTGRPHPVGQRVQTNKTGNGCYEIDRFHDLEVGMRPVSVKISEPQDGFEVRSFAHFKRGRFVDEFVAAARING